MTEHQDLLTLVGETNPYPEDSTIPEAWIVQRPPIDRIVAQSPTPLTGSRSRPGIMVAAASAAVIVLLVGGLALLLRSQQLEPADQPTVTDTPVTTIPPPTTTVPPDSSLGELSWTSFPNELPPDLVKLPRRTAAPAFVATDGGFVAASPTELWTSPDGISWTPGPLPFTPSGDVSLEKDATGTYWLFDNAPGTTLVGLWRSDDAVSWSQMDTSAIRAPSLSGVEWSLFPHRFIGGLNEWESPIMSSNGETILASWRIIGSVPWQEILGLEGDVETSSWDPQSQILELTLGSWIKDPAGDGESEIFEVTESVRLSLAVVSEDPLTVEATDVESGALVHTFIGSVEGFSTEELVAGIVDGFNIDVVGVSDDGSTFEAAPTPWAVNEAGSALLAFQKYPRIVASGGRFYAYSVEADRADDREPDFDPGTVETWVSTDGRTWTSAGTPAFAEGQDVTAVTGVLERDGVLVVGVELRDSAQKLWWSENGIDWARIERGPTSGGQAHLADSGWVFTASVNPPTGSCCAFVSVFAIWVSQDGKNWQPVDIDSAEGLSEPVSSSGGYEVHVAGDTIFVFNRFDNDGPADPPQGTVWIATFDD